MKYCSECGNKVEFKTPNGDSYKRHVCTHCGKVHYINPRIISGCLVYKDNKVLLCKRAIEPRRGLWTLPGGFMENDETTRNAAKRETLEEVGTQVEPKELFLIANSPHAHHVNMLYLAKLQKMDFHATDESSEVKLFARNDIPWDEIAFYTIKLALTWFYEDIDKGQFSLHEIDF